MPAVGPPKIGIIADLALNPILLLGEADGGGLEDPHGLRDGCCVLDGPRVQEQSTKEGRIDGDSRHTG